MESNRIGTGDRLDPPADTGTSAGIRRKIVHSEAKLSWVLGGLAGLLGVTAFAQPSEYFVASMTGNVHRSVLATVRGDQRLALTTAALLLAFVGGVVIASFCRRYLWETRPHASTVLTTLALVLATVLDATVGGGPAFPLPVLPVSLVAFGLGALNTTFVKNGEVSTSLSYMTGALVKLGQGVERHLSGGDITDWLGYFLLCTSIVAGAAIGAAISLVTGGTQSLAIASVICALTAVYTFFYADRRGVWR